MSFTLIAALAALCLFLLMLVFSEIGRRVGIARLARDAEGLAKGAGAAEAAVFGLLGLLLAFTFSGAASRFEDRRHLVVEEANAIGTAWLRIDLLPADAQLELRGLFRRYLDARLAATRPGDDLAASQAKLAESVSLQAEMWKKAVVASARTDASPQATMLVLPALNALIDITGTRQMATLNHPPAVVFALLGALSVIGAMLIGYATSPNSDRSWLHVVTYAVILSLTVYVIVDIEYPRLGLIRVDSADQVLMDLRRSME